MNIGVFLPNWIGDAAMATPLLRGLRRYYGPEAHIVGVMKPYVAEVFSGSPWLSDILFYNRRSKDRSHRGGEVIRRLKLRQLDVAFLLPNSLRAALLAWRAGAVRRIGYARDGRGWLLTDRVAAPMAGAWPRRRHAIVPAIRHYLGLLRAFDLPEAGRRMELAVTADERAAGEAVLASAGVGGRYAVLVPGGRYGSAKLWPAGHFATLARQLADDGLAVVISTAPGEHDVADGIAAKSPAVALHEHGLRLGALKAILASAAVCVTNDTGARHVAIALGTPTVTLFGPTDPLRTTLGVAVERELRVDVPCRPCQLKACPLPEPQTQRCLRELSPERVRDAVVEVMSTRPGDSPPASGATDAPADAGG